MSPSTTLFLILLVVVTAGATAFSSSSPTGDGPPRRHRRSDTGTVGCLAHERDALLEFKRGITGDPPGLLASWQPGGHQDCCRWRGVRCSNRTGHVVGLHLRNMGHADETYFIIDYQETALVGQISPSVLSLQHLKHLDLSFNRLQGPRSRIPEFLGFLKNLRYLNLSGIPFRGSVPPQLGNLTNLHHLDLSSSDSLSLDGTHMNSTDISWLTRLPFLRYLNMRSVDLSRVLGWAHVVNMVPSLMVLDLSSCSLTSANQSLPHLNLTRLETLDLSENQFHHPVASCWFWNLTSLRYLGVGITYLYGRFPDALGGMSSLQVLDFSSSGDEADPYSTDGRIDIMTTNMTNLCNLEILVLSHNNMDGNITELFDRFPQCSPSKLKELHLDNNNFTGGLPNWVGRWASLLTLDLSNNRITGSIPSEIAILHNLLTLDISNNLLIGPVPSEIGILSNLTELHLGGNNLNGVMTHEHLDGLKGLTEIDLSSNSLKIMLPPGWLPPFRLQYAYFASCEMGPQFPTWLQSQVDIDDLDISSTAIFDSLPDWFCTTFSNAWKLNISNNGINGTLPVDMEVMTSLERLHLNSNQLTGQLPRFPESLNVLDISRNSLSGPLPSNFGAPFIEDLRLFSNHITGHVPQYICQLQSLDILDLADNLFEGELPRCFQLRNLRMLIASNNMFSGKFPPSLQRCTRLYILDLTWNNFSGELPMWIGDLANLEIVRLSYNNFSGSIPATITNLTKLLHLNLAANSLSGVLPWNLSNLRGMEAGSFPTTFGHYVPIMNLTVGTKWHERYYEEGEIFEMVNIDFSSNFLTGGIPEEITSLDGVINLNLSWNLLSGKIPGKIGVMQALESLDLSRNMLYGELPQSLSNLTYLSYLDLSHDNFTGRIPSGGQLDTLYLQNPYMYDGNIGLCGHPLQKNCSNNSEPKHGDQKTDEHDSKLLSFSFGLGVGYVVGLWVVFCVILFKKSWRIAYFRLFDKVYVFVVVTWARLAQKTATH